MSDHSFGSGISCCVTLLFLRDLEDSVDCLRRAYRCCYRNKRILSASGIRRELDGAGLLTEGSCRWNYLPMYKLFKCRFNCYNYKEMFSDLKHANLTQADESLTKTFNEHLQDESYLFCFIP